MARSWRGLLAATGALALVVSACGQTTPPAAGTGAPGSPAAAAFTRGQGGDLKILYWQAPTILNQHQSTGTKDSDAARLVLEPLASWDFDGKKPIANGLAAEIPTPENGGVSKDFTTVTWKLRSGVKWSDGTPFTADDVAFTFEYMKDK
nr:peptide ABC transporter substrate-binding protein [Chloroflexota bacterium]